MAEESSSRGKNRRVEHPMSGLERIECACKGSSDNSDQGKYMMGWHISSQCRHFLLNLIRRTWNLTYGGGEAGGGGLGLRAQLRVACGGGGPMRMKWMQEVPFFEGKSS